MVHRISSRQKLMQMLYRKDQSIVAGIELDGETDLPCDLFPATWFTDGQLTTRRNLGSAKNPFG